MLNYIGLNLLAVITNHTLACVEKFQNQTAWLSDLQIYKNKFFLNDLLNFSPKRFQLSKHLAIFSKDIKKLAKRERSLRVFGND